jgi:hypothetical protein
VVAWSGRVAVQLDQWVRAVLRDAPAAEARRLAAPAAACGDAASPAYGSRAGLGLYGVLRWAAEWLWGCRTAP